MYLLRHSSFLSRGEKGLASLFLWERPISGVQTFGIITVPYFSIHCSINLKLFGVALHNTAPICPFCSCQFATLRLDSA